jgi:arabinan endo-1,5-alpha-L-arabinosidase
MNFIQIYSLLVAITGLLIAGSSCSKGGSDAVGGSDTLVVQPPAPPVFDINSITDSYAAIAPFSNYLRWGSHNVHDPSIKKFGDTYYSYSTDVAYGTDVRPGIQIRKSKDLINWQFFSWVFSGIPSMGAQFITQSGGVPFNSLWAPAIVKVGAEYRLYYSLSSAKPRLSVIGLAVASSPEGPFVEKGLVVTSKDDNTRQTNAIDPAVLIAPNGEHYFYYGSGWDGIYMLKLNPATGLALSDGDKGVRIANRGFTNGRYNGNIEGPEVIYHPVLNKYFIFIAYDWIDTKYNVRVGRGDSPNGPFYDFAGRDINLDEDHKPMILAPYKFENHSGYQGVSHCTVFDDGKGNYFLASQARPGFDKFFMNLHVRPLHFTQDGWPVVSSQRFAAVEQTAVAQADLAGQWERIVLNYTIVPGYDREQTSPDFQVSQTITLDAGGTINGTSSNSWTYSSPWLELRWNNNETIEKVKVERGRDWENKKNTILFTGLDQTGTAVWGKKK